MNWFSRTRIFCLVLLIALPGLAAAVLHMPDDDDHEISASDLPESLQRALKDVDVEEVEVTTVYEVDIEEHGVEIELRLDGQGRLLSITVEPADDDDDDDDDDDRDDGAQALSESPVID